jgi:hypothetical protein
VLLEREERLSDQLLRVKRDLILRRRKNLKPSKKTTEKEAPQEAAV